MDEVRVIKALTECSAASGAIQAEHFAIEQALNTLNQAMLAGASPEQMTEIVDIAVDFHEAHFANEEEAFADCGYQGLDAHVKDHQLMLKRLRTARREISKGKLEATLNVSDLLYAFHNHVAAHDRDAHAHMLRQKMERGQNIMQSQIELDRLMRLSA
jgi:hemerythrin-like metal-binding protein